MNGVHKILLIRTDRIGDVLMNLPALKVLRRAYPKSWITLMLDEKVAPLLEPQPEKDEIMRINSDRFASDADYREKFLKNIESAHFDAAIVLNPSKHMHWMVFRAGIPLRAGYRRKWGFLLNRTINDDKAGAERHEIDSNLKLAALFSDKPWDGKMTLAVESRAALSVAKRLEHAGISKKQIAVVHPGTSNEKKRWPLEKFSEVCRWLVNEKGFSVVLIGGEEETAVSSELAARAGVPTTDWTGRLSLQELAAFLHDRKIAFLLSADSGPAHIAWMSGTPVVALYAADVPGSDPKRWGPRDEKSQVIFKAVKDIEVSEVREKIGKVLS